MSLSDLDLNELLGCFQKSSLLSEARDDILENTTSRSEVPLQMVNMLVNSLKLRVNSMTDLFCDYIR